MVAIDILKKSSQFMCLLYTHTMRTIFLYKSYGNPYTEKKDKIKRVEIGLGWNRERGSSGLPSIPQGPEQVSTAMPDSAHRDLELYRCGMESILLDFKHFECKN